MNRHNEYIPPPCPNCKKEHGAIMRSTEWGHSICCCCSECGEKRAKKLTKNRNSKIFIDAVRMFNEAKERMHYIEHAGIFNDGPEFEDGSWAEGWEERSINVEGDIQ